MSKAFDNAELVRTRLITAPTEAEQATAIDITGVTVIVDRQKNINVEVAKAVAKASGTAVTILWQGFRVLDKNAKRPRLAHSYNITVHSKPVISGTEFPADEVMEAIIIRLWQWVPGGGHAFNEALVSDGGLVPDKSFLKYDLEFTIPTTL